MSEILQMSDYVATGKDLKVYRLAFDISLQLHRASLEFPKHEQFALADQLRRASKSICANVVEGFDRQNHSRPEFKRFLMMASSSAAEVGVWLDYALALKYITEAQHREWSAAFEQVNRMLHKLRNKVE